MKNMKKAQSLIEYGLILALVAVIAVTVLSRFGETITEVGNRTNSDVNRASQNATDNYCKSIGCEGVSETTGMCESCPGDEE